MILDSSALARSRDKLRMYLNRTRPIDTKRGKVVSYRDRLPLVKSYDPLIP